MEAGPLTVEAATLDGLSSSSDRPIGAPFMLIDAAMFLQRP